MRPHPPSHQPPCQSPDGHRTADPHKGAPLRTQSFSNNHPSPSPVASMMSKAGPWILASTLLLALLAGCVSPQDSDGSGADEDALGHWSIYETPKLPDYDFSDAIEVVHAHDVRELHTDHHGLELIGHNDLLEGLDLHVYSGGFLEVHLRGDLAVVASLTGMRAFTLVDISDLTDPQVLSHFYSGNDNWDVRISEDARYVFVGCQGSGLYTSTPVGACTDDDGIPSLNDENQGIVTVDIQDPTNPQAVCWTPSASNHNLYTATLDDNTTVVANDNTQIFVLKDDGCLEQVAGVPGVHDVRIAKHPITQEWLLYTGTNGMTIYNIDDPSDPYIAGELDTAGHSGATGWHEQAPAPVTFGDIHITMGGGERFSGEPGVVSVINTTDPESPEVMGTWRLPVDAPMDDETFWGQQSYKFSEHNMWVNQWGQVCIGHYHAGVWVIDISTPQRMKEPVTLGFYQPHEFVPGTVSTIHPAGGVMTSSPYVWGCQWTDDGRHVAIPDMHSGLYILEGQWFQERTPEN